MKVLILAAILAVATNCFAEEGWTVTNYTVSSSDNLQIEFKAASIESITASTVRALVRFVRHDPSSREWFFPKTVNAVESTVDFDCKKHRYKALDETRTTDSGYRVPIETKSVPTFDETGGDGSLWETTRKKVCKFEGK